MKKVIHIFPSREIRNPYLKSLRRVLERDYDCQGSPKLKDFLFQLLKRNNSEQQFILLDNWIENYLFAANGSLAIKSVVKLFARTILAKAYYSKLVLVRHNKIPHAAASSWLNQFVLNCFYRFYDVVFVHDDKFVDAKKVYYLPHPLYERVVDNGSIKKNYFTVIGLIDRRKNIDLFISEINHRINIKILGHANDVDYLDLCRALGEGKNIQFEVDKLDDFSVQNVIIESRGIVCTNQLETSYISGNYILAASLGVPLISIKNDFLSRLKERYIEAPIFLFDSFGEMALDLLDDDFSAKSSECRWNLADEFGDANVLRCFNEAVNI